MLPINQWIILKHLSSIAYIIKKCNTYFVIWNDNAAILTLHTIKQIETRQRIRFKFKSFFIPIYFFFMPLLKFEASRRQKPEHIPHICMYTCTIYQMKLKRKEVEGGGVCGQGKREHVFTINIHLLYHSQQIHIYYTRKRYTF